MRALLALATILLAAAPASAVALLEDAPGRALVQASPAAEIVGAPGAEARWAPPGAAPGAWRPLPTARPGAPLGAGGCERGLCNLTVVELRGGAARVLEGNAGVLLRPAAPAGEAAPSARPAATTPSEPAPGAKVSFASEAGGGDPGDEPRAARLLPAPAFGALAALAAGRALHRRRA